jgi:hypothetical protein
VWQWLSAARGSFKNAFLETSIIRSGDGIDRRRCSKLNVDLGA